MLGATQGTTYGRVLNLTDQPIQIRAGERLTTASDMMDPGNQINLFSDTAGANSGDDPNPEDSKEAKDGSWIPVDLTSSNLSPQEKEEFDTMIRSKYKAFARDPEFPEKTGLLKLKLDTGSSRPLAQPPRRMPYAQDEFLQNKLLIKSRNYPTLGLTMGRPNRHCPTRRQSSTRD